MADGRLRGTPAGVLAASRALCELAQLERDAGRRREWRREAIRICTDGKAASSLVVVAERANRTVDLFFEPYGKEDRVAMQAQLADAASSLDRGLRTSPDDETQALLLVERSSILRCQALNISHVNRRSRLSEALRAANLAHDCLPTSLGAHLAIGQCWWALARTEDTDDGYATALGKAEEAFGHPGLASDPVGQLVLARFYRQSWRPAGAVETFRRYREVEHNLRRMWAEAHTVGEAAVQVAQNDYPPFVRSAALELARTVLREAVDSGFENARTFLALAQVEAITGDAEIADETLRRLGSRDVESWVTVVREAASLIETDQFDPFSGAFALGLGDAMVWNALGTYARRFQKDNSIAESCYRTGLRLSPRSAVLCTNLARTLVDRDTRESRVEAAKYLQRAASFADRSFGWWREVQAKLDLVAGRRPRRAREQDAQALDSDGVMDSGARIAALAALEVETDGQARGNRFERLWARILRASPGCTDVQGSFRQRVGPSDSSRQVDNAFVCHARHYVVEVKWERDPVGPDAIDGIVSRLKVPGVTGLLVSMTGFARGAVDSARTVVAGDVRLVLMDGDDVRQLVRGTVVLAQLLERKELHLSFYADPYPAKVPDTLSE